ncbi:fatty acyl-CoA reductase wat-like isoform X2 [Halictus rubicundus]|uniref:fatty acyl-CoA reductase wat-like isoform X2 n=1 Tax=Halictus rubicundus TaxID=77578 RepID=UPI0040356E91
MHIDCIKLSITLEDSLIRTGDRYKKKMKISDIHKMSKPLDSLQPQVSRSYEKSEIAEFYAGTNVLITGGTGFLGKLLIEKLLRSCPRITKIYMLVRPKKGKSPEERFKENFAEVIYDRLRKEQPNFLNKIVMIEGDASEEDFVITPEVKATLTDTNIIFHAAATVRFDEKLRVAVNTNVRTTKCLLLWARQLPNLKGFVYVSTAFSNCVNSTIDEIHYKHTIEADKLITLVNCLNDDQLLAMEPILRGKAPNNYTLTKAAAENAVLKYGDGLPVAIVRPSIVIPTHEEPIRGWINNLYGITGMIAGASVGLIHTTYGKLYLKAELIPADYVIANIVAAAWDIGTRERTTKLEEDSVLCDEEKIPIYNSVSSAQNPITVTQYIKFNEAVGFDAPPTKAIWYCALVTREYFYLYKIESFVLHTIPGFIGDTILRLMGQKPMLMDTYRKINKFMNAMEYFNLREWNFRNENVQKLWSKLNSADRKLFNFNVENLDWENYFQYHWRGLRVYLLNDPLDNVEQALVRYKKLRMLHYTVLAILWLLVLWIAVFFVSFLWS